MSSPTDRSTAENGAESDEITHEKFQKRTLDEFIELVKEIQVKSKNEQRFLKLFKKCLNQHQ